MKCIVIYHSLTGNTKKIAQAIHKGMSRTGEQCDIARIKDINTPNLVGYDLIGLGSPVVKLRELGNMTLFIQQIMKNVDGKHGFAFCTHGALPGFYLANVVPAMMQRGLTVIGWNDWFGSVNFPAIPKPYFTDGHPDDIDLNEAEEFGLEMVERSRRIYNGETQLIPKFPVGKEYDELYHPMQPNKEMRDIIKRFFTSESASFTVNKEKCNYPKCTLCIDNCPVDAIDFSVSPPVFNRNCEKCFLCESTCPRGAIEYDYEPLHEVHFKLMVAPLQESLEMWEARGRFRRLVPLDKIGWDTPFWKFKKPRYKIV